MVNKIPATNNPSLKLQSDEDVLGPGHRFWLVRKLLETMPRYVDCNDERPKALEQLKNGLTETREGQFLIEPEPAPIWLRETIEFPKADGLEDQAHKELIYLWLPLACAAADHQQKALNSAGEVLKGIELLDKAQSLLKQSQDILKDALPDRALFELKNTLTDGDGTLGLEGSYYFEGAMLKRLLSDMPVICEELRAAVDALNRNKKHRRTDSDEWRVNFVIVLGCCWFRFKQKKPSETDLFCTFVNNASLVLSLPPFDWKRTIRNARSQADFEKLNQTIWLEHVYPRVWLSIRENKIDRTSSILASMGKTANELMDNDPKFQEILMARLRSKKS